MKSEAFQKQSKPNVVDEKIANIDQKTFSFI